MKKHLQKTGGFIPLLAAGLLAVAPDMLAANYAGNGNTGFGGKVGNGTLSVTDNGTNLTFTMTPQGGSLGGDALALYIDTGAAGFASTTNFNDASDGGHSSVSGYSSSGRSVLTFTNGFRPSYGISFSDSYTSLFQLANGGNGSFTYVTGTGTSPLSFTVSASQIGLVPGVSSPIRIFGSFISTSAYRSTEAIAGNDSTLFSQGWNPFTQTAYATYNFAAPPASSHPVTFQVDMTAQVVSGAFNPNVDSVYAAGTFQTNAGAAQAFALAPTVSNTNIYTGTYPDFNPTNTAEQFKFNFVHVASTTTNYEGVDNRPFTQQANAQTLALVYFDDVFAVPSATTNYLTFSTDMGPQIALGHFNPGNGDTIQVLGTLENPKWTIGGFILTNNPASSQSNIYSGTIADGNYPGSFENYKFVIHTSGGDTYESGNNRSFFTPTNAATFPLAYFNNVFSIYSTPVTFQVDMTVPILSGAFNPGNGGTVSAAGTFQTNQWTAGAFVLTNNPAGANTNLFSGTYVDFNAPGTGEQYKFAIVSGVNTNYEGVANRTFLLGSTAQTLPLVFWNNQDTNNVLLAATTVTFTVNMTNAVDLFGNPFNPSTDNVLVNGDFTSPPWVVNWTDPLISSDYGAYVLLNNPPGSLLYTGTFTVPAGNSLAVQYKYGIDHNASGINTNSDNEAGFALNHMRYIRATGAYNFPMDVFGIQRTNLAAASEPSFGNLAIGQPAGGYLPLTWLGRPGVHLQYTTNLNSGVWLDLNATAGTNSSRWPQTNGTAFFRLVNP